MPWNWQKTCSAKEKSKKKTNTPRQKGFDEKKIKIAKENTQIKEIENNLKNFNKYGKKSKTNECYCCYQEKSKILLQIRKKQLNDQSSNWTSPGWLRELGTKQQKNERTTEWTI